MTAQIDFNKSGTSIEFGKCFRKRQGYVVLAKAIQNGSYWKATDYQFLASTALPDSAAASYRGKSSRHKAVVPQSYTGLVVSESEIFGERTPEKWFYWFNNGQVEHDAETLAELALRGCFE